MFFFCPTGINQDLQSSTQDEESNGDVSENCYESQASSSAQTDPLPVPCQIMVNEQPKNGFKCQFFKCDRQTTKRYEMKKHFQSHTVPFQCNQCQRRFSRTSDNLKNHVCKPKNLEEESSAQTDPLPVP